MVALIAAIAARAAPCAGDAPADAAFAVHPRAGSVWAVVEVWPDGAPGAWTTAVLDALDRHQVHATIVVPPGFGDPAVLARAKAGPHALGIDLPDALVPVDATAPRRELVRAVRALEGAGGPVRTAVAALPSRASEAVLGDVGFRALVARAGAPSATPRIAGRFEGQTRLDLVIPPGPAGEPCAPFSPANADRVGRALDDAQTTGGPAVVRIALVGAGGRPEDAEVLERWLTEVAEPSGARLGTAEEAREALVPALRRPEVAPTAPTAPGRAVERAAILAAAAALGDGEVLPRVLPGELSLADAFAALLAAVAEPGDGPVRVIAMAGPAQVAASALDGPSAVDPAALRALAAAVLAHPPAEIPAAMRVGDRLLTARELLVALASAARGDDPVLTRPVYDPDPNARGLGWGGP